MPECDLVVRGGEAILPGRGRHACDLAIRNGRIAAILAPGQACAAATEFSARGLVVLPGVIDVHLHLGHGKDISRPREPGDADAETAAAAKGGVTCFIPYLMATDPFEHNLRRGPRADGGGSAHRFRLSFHASRPRRSSPPCRAMPASMACPASRSS